MTASTDRLSLGLGGRLLLIGRTLRIFLVVFCALLVIGSAWLVPHHVTATSVGNPSAAVVDEIAEQSVPQVQWSVTRVISESVSATRRPGSASQVVPRLAAEAGDASLGSTATTGSLQDAYAQLHGMGLKPIGGGSGPPAWNGYFSLHFAQQAVERDAGLGVGDAAIADATSNPLSVFQQANGNWRFVGQNAVVILHDEGWAVTTWARNSLGWRNVP